MKCLWKPVTTFWLRGGGMHTSQRRSPASLERVFGKGETSEGVATKSAEGSDWISFASSKIRRTPGDLVFSAMMFGD